MFSLNEIYKAQCICSTLCSFFFFFLLYAAIKFSFTNDKHYRKKNKARIIEPLFLKIITSLFPTRITTNCLFVLLARAVIQTQ